MNPQYTLKEKYDIITKAALNESSRNPLKIVKDLMDLDCVNIHGPEHHFIDGAAFLAAFNNSGGNIDLSDCLLELASRASAMPGAMCGYWGICGSVASVGAALSIIHKTGPLSTDDFYKDHMEYTSGVIREMSKIGGARCCKRNAFLSLLYAARFVREKYGIIMEEEKPVCTYSAKNKQCLGVNCPFHS